jgi:hypothetical protein
LNETVSKLKNAQIIKINGFHAIVEDGYDTLFPVPISPYNYECKCCQTNYSLIYSFGCHDSNDKFANPKSKLCTCSIRQIIYPALM